MIGIIGYGFVGQAVGSILEEPFIVVDPKHELGVSLAVLMDHSPDFIFIAVPTPSQADGSCDDSIVMDYITKLKDFAGVVIVKSTVPPKTVETILAARPATVVWPELLRERTAARDIRYPTVLPVGADDENFKRVRKFILERTEIEVEVDQIKQLTPVEASIFKYTVNSFLSVKVVFMHQMYLWLKKRGQVESWDKIADVLADEPRIGSSHLRAPGEHGFGFSGHCFPKDTEALFAQAYNDGTWLELLGDAIQINAKLQKIA
jgi:UDPglucose 6-dehydrogenase